MLTGCWEKYKALIAFVKEIVKNVNVKVIVKNDPLNPILGQGPVH